MGTVCGLHSVIQACLFTYLSTAVWGGHHEARLIDTLLLNPLFNSIERPVELDSQPLKVEFTVNLQQIIDVDEKNQVIHTNLWLTIRWSDYKLRWNPEHFGNITDIRLPVNKVWKPDILMYSSANTNFDGSYPTNVVVYSDGVLEQIPPGMFTSSCPIEIKWFPFDDQKCKMKFGSWSYDGGRIDLQLPEGKTSGIIDDFSMNGEWDLIGMPAVRNVVPYDCCPNSPYIDITFTVHIRRRKLYYMVNIVAPCLMLSALTLLTFLIPPDAGEKISFGVTILLSLTVFLLLVAEALPATSDAIPLIALYFASVMLMNALSVVFTVLVLSYHYRTGSSSKMPRWVKGGICLWLAWILRMERPGISFEKTIKGCARARNDSHTKLSKSKDTLPMNGIDEEMPRFLDGFGSETTHVSNTPPDKLPSADSCASVADEVSTARNELRAILGELRFITNQMRDNDEKEKVTVDWKFASAVIDRLLLWLFTIMTVVTTLAILFSAPNVFSSS